MRYARFRSISATVDSVKYCPSVGRVKGFRFHALAGGAEGVVVVEVEVLEDEEEGETLPLPPAAAAFPVRALLVDATAAAEAPEPVAGAAVGLACCGAFAAEDCGAAAADENWEARRENNNRDDCTLMLPLLPPRARDGRSHALDAAREAMEA